MAGAATYPLGVIARLLLLSERRVQQLSAEGVIPRAERGRYELAPAVQGYLRYLRDRSLGADGVDTALDTSGAAKLRLLQARARVAELEAERLGGTLLVRTQVEQAWTTLVLTLRAHLLALPVRGAPLALAAGTLPGTIAVLERLIHEALDELSTRPVLADPSAGQPDAAGATPAEPVGLD
jgi:hypothetical protein